MKLYIGVLLVWLILFLPIFSLAQNVNIGAQWFDATSIQHCWEGTFLTAKWRAKGKNPKKITIPVFIAKELIDMLIFGNDFDIGDIVWGVAPSFLPDYKGRVTFHPIPMLSFNTNSKFGGGISFGQVWLGKKKKVYLMTGLEFSSQKNLEWVLGLKYRRKNFAIGFHVYPTTILIRDKFVHGNEPEKIIVSYGFSYFP